MKKVFLTSAIAFIFLFSFSQAPQAFNYQSVVRNASGNPMTNTTISVRATIHDGSSTGTIVYQETQYPTTNQFGLINIEVGTGTVVSGNFSTINWGSGSKWMEIEANFGSGYVPMGTSQLVSVPYALYSNSSGSTGQNAYSAYGTGSLTVTSSTTTFTLVPGLSLSVNIPANSVVLVTTTGAIATQGTGAGGFSVLSMGLFIDGALPANGGYQRISALNNSGLAGSIATWAMDMTNTLSAGTHTFSVQTKYSQGSSATVSSDNTGVLQGSLNVVVIKK